MNPIKLYFYKWLKGGNKTFDLNGILFKPRFDEEKEFIYWDVKNPNNVSYSEYGLEAFIDDQLYEFSKVTVSEFHHKLHRRQDLSTIPQKLYINDEDFDTLFKLVQNVTKFKFDNLQSDIHVFDMGFDIDSDILGIILDVKLINPIDPKTKEKLTYTEVQERLIGLNEDDDFNDYISYHLFANLQGSFWYNRPNIFDRDNMVVDIYPQFYTDKGRRMKHW